MADRDETMSSGESFSIRTTSQDGVSRQAAPSANADGETTESTNREIPVVSIHWETPDHKVIPWDDFIVSKGTNWRIGGIVFAVFSVLNLAILIWTGVREGWESLVSTELGGTIFFLGLAIGFGIASAHYLRKSRLYPRKSELRDLTPEQYREAIKNANQDQLRAEKVYSTTQEIRQWLYIVLGIVCVVGGFYLATMTTDESSGVKRVIVGIIILVTGVPTVTNIVKRRRARRK